MKRILERIALHASQHPRQTALADADGVFSYRELQQEIQRLAGVLDGRRILLLLANGRAWVALDLAIQRLGATCIPVPPFFSDSQLQHVLADALPDLIVTNQPQRIAALLHTLPAQQLTVAGQALACFHRSSWAGSDFPAHTAKLTYTSGTTGQPKGVCLSGTTMAQVAIGLADAVQAGPADRGLSLLPLSTLLENIGVYAALYSGAQACVPDLAGCGMNGSSGVDATQLMAALARYRPSSLILVPQLLKLLVAAAEAGAPLPDGLRFIAVGGARSAPALIERARRAGLPVYEGYGLSEACSVVSLNLPDRDRVGSVGRPLPHLQVRIADDGEVLVSGALFSGYLGQPVSPLREWHTGDLGHLDADGYLHITGRKRLSYATAFGRNVSPDWVEGELLASSLVLQAAVFGEGRPYNVAVLAPHPHATAASLTAAVNAANARLPDYARVRRWIVADQPFSPRNGLARAAGTMDRDAVAAAYAEQLDHLYDEEPAHVAV